VSDGSGDGPGAALDAAVAVLRDAGVPLHWTVIQDRALRAGLVDPFATPNVRREVLGALREGTRRGIVRTLGGGVYELAVPPGGDCAPVL
jgi:hypothetical protein